MFAKKGKRAVAIVGMLVMCVSMLASCQVGGTYAETPGNQDVVSVQAKDDVTFVEYTGDKPVIRLPSGDPIYKDGSDFGGNSSGGSDESDTPGGSNGNNGSSSGGSGSNNGGSSNGGSNNTGNTPGGNNNSGEDDDDTKVNYNPANKLKVMSYNLRIANDSVEFGGKKDIVDRMPRFKKIMDMYQPDVVGMAECGPKHIELLQKDYSNASYGKYELHYKYRSSSGSGETTPVMWNTNVLECLDKGTFWLSDTPNVESTADNWGATLPRIVCWVKLKVKATGKIFLFYSTHFDFEDSVHVNSVNLIFKKGKEMGAFSKYPLFLVGDCNMTPWGDGYTAVYNTEELVDINWELNNDNAPGTSNGYHLPVSDGRPVDGDTIDYIFYSKKTVHPLHYEVIDIIGDDGDYVSDHCGLYAEAALL